MADGECVKVIVRCRPMNDRENGLRCKNILAMDPNKGQCSIKNPSDPKAAPKLFTFDGAYFTDSTTESIYNEIAYPLVEGVTEGYNGTIFAYGQTGCGKSFTMQGITNPQTQRGIIPRAFDHIFETVSVVDGTKFLLHASYCEIYNEEIRDLLGKDAKAKLDLKEHPEKGVYVNGLSMHPVQNVLECERIMEKGWKNRSTGATLMNADSSRSHSIFAVALEMITVDDQGEEHIRAGKLNLVDLAGSERQAKTGATGDRLKEATKINLSLSALGNVISALVDGKSKHIPYRDSKLTRLLQDSLGGNTKTLMAACLSPADNNYEETLSTLRYANRAKNIQNKPKINEDPKDALLREYQEEIEKLKAMLMGQLPIPAGGFHNVQAGSQAKDDKEEARQELELEKQRIREEYDAKMTEMEQEYEKEKMSKAKLEQNLIKLRMFYDTKLSSVDGQLKDLPSTAAVLGEIEWEDGDIQFGEDGRGGAMIERDGEELMKGLELSGRASQGQIQGQVDEEGEGDEDERVDSVTAGSAVDATAATRRTKHGKKTKQSKQSEGGEDMDEVMSQQSDDEIAGKVDPLDRPGSVAGAAMPPGPSAGSIEVNNVTASQNGDVTPRTREAAMMGRRGGEQEGLVAPSSSPTQSNMQEQLRLNQDEARRRIQELEQQMVGGEMKDNKEVKERRKKRKTFADERKQKLMEAVANMDDDYIMLEIYDNIGEEVKAKTAMLEKAKNKVEALNRDILDIRSEFEFERIDMLDTIRKQDRELALLQGLLDKIHPCLRRDCNYSNLDKIKTECKWNDEEQRWLMPRMMISTTSLPVTEATNVSPRSPDYGMKEAIMPGTRGIDGKSRTRPMMNGDVHASIYDNEDDRFRDKLMRKHDKSDNYFKPKRASQLLGSTPEPAKINMTEIKDTYKKTQNSMPATNGYGNHEDGVSGGLRAAAVHGQLMQDDNVVRRPLRLEALPQVQPTGGKKSKRKKNAMDPL